MIRVADSKTSDLGSILDEVSDFNYKFCFVEFI